MSTLDTSLILMSQHVAMISGLLPILHSCEVKSGSGLRMRLCCVRGIVSNTQFGYYWSVLCTSPVQKVLCVQPLKPYIIIKLHPVAFPSNSNTTLNNFIFVCVKALVWWQLASSTQLIWPLAILLVSVYVPFQYKKAVHVHVQVLLVEPLYGLASCGIYK